MKALLLNIICILSLMILAINQISAQILVDSSITAYRRNIIRINPTPPVLVGMESVVLGYERVIKPHQSISINIGRLKFKNFVNLGLGQFGINTNRKSGGISIAIDYRRYFKKRNKGFAPDGLYWGPFLTYYRYGHELSLTYSDPINFTTSEVILTTDLQVRHIGIELGYQFIIAKRLSIDLIIIGPSWGKYIADFEVSGSLKVNEQSDLYKALYDKITERIPGLETLIDNRKITKTGFFSTNTFGMRYLVQIGFLF